MQEEKKFLKQELGFTDEEVEGYFECFIENFINIKVGDKKNEDC